MILTDPPEGEPVGSRELVAARLRLDFGARLKAARKAMKMTQIKLGKRIGIDDKHSASTIISAIEAGKTVPSLWRARMLCEVVGIPIYEMLERVPPDEE